MAHILKLYDDQRHSKLVKVVAIEGPPTAEQERAMRDAGYSVDREGIETRIRPSAKAIQASSYRKPITNFLTFCTIALYMLCIFFTILGADIWWFYLYVLAPLSVATVTLRLTLAKTEREDNKRASKNPILELTSPHRSLRIDQPNPVLVWAIKTERAYNYPACDYRIPVDEVGDWLRKHKAYDPSLIEDIANNIVLLRATIGRKKYLDFSNPRGRYPAVRDLLKADYDRQREAYLKKFDFQNWVSMMGGEALAVAFAIQEDSDIVLSYELAERIAKSRKLPNYSHHDADEAIMADKMRAVATRVRAIYDQAAERQKLEADAIHEGNVAFAKSLFTEQ